MEWSVPPSDHEEAMTPPNARLNDRYTTGEYLAANSEWGEEDAEWKAEQVGILLDRNGIVPTSICDIGCGTGGVLDALGRRLTRIDSLVGYELSATALSLAPTGRRERIELVNDTHDSDNRKFDLALCLDVFEHVDDYYGLLRSIQSKAELVIFNIPIAITATTVIKPAPLRRSYEQVGHIHHYTPTSACLALEYAGYDIVDRMHTNPADRKRASGVGRRSIGDRVRRVAARVDLDLAARLITGFPLLVLARPRSV